MSEFDRQSRPSVIEALRAEARSRAASTETDSRSTAFQVMLQKLTPERAVFQEPSGTSGTVPTLDRELVFDLALRNPAIARALQPWHRKELTWEQVTYLIIWSLAQEQQTLIAQMLALHNHLPPVPLQQDLQNGSDPSNGNGIHPARRAGDASRGV